MVNVVRGILLDDGEEVLPYEDEDKMNEMDKLMEKYGVEIDNYCSGDYPMMYICIKDTHLTAYRGSPVVVKMRDITDKDAERLKQFCKEVNVNWREPGWWLASYWG